MDLSKFLGSKTNVLSKYKPLPQLPRIQPVVNKTPPRQPEPSLLRQFVEQGLPEAANQITSGAIAGEKALVQSALTTKPGMAITNAISKRISPTPTKLEISINSALYNTPPETLTDYGKSILPKFAQKGPLPALAGLGLTALDFTGAGGEKSAIKALSMAKNDVEAFKVLKTLNIAEDVAKRVAPILAKTSKEAEVSRIISQLKPQETIKPSLNLSKERGFVRSTKEQFPEFKVAGQYIPRSTDRLATQAANLVKDDIGTAEKLALSGSDDKAVATASELLKHYAEEASKAKGVIQSALYDKAAEVGNTIARKLTESGRSVQAASILGHLTPEGQVRFAAKEIQKFNEEVGASKGGLLGLKKKIPELTGKQTQDIVDEMKAINGMADGEEKAIRFQKLQDHISQLIPSPFIKKLTTIWKAGLLTGIKTTGTNVFANASHFGSEVIKDIPAKVVDSVASLFTGEKTIGGPTLKGTKKRLKEGFEKGFRYLRTGYDERNMATKLDYNKVNFTKGRIVEKFPKLGKAVNAYTQSVFRVLGAEDQPFYYGALARSIADQAKAEASTKGLKGLERDKYISNLIENPNEKILKYALKDAETAVFQNKTALGGVAKKLQQIGGGAGELVVPFGRTPAAVAMQIVNYSPIGIAKTIIENVGKGRFDQRLFSQGIGRGLTGTGVLAVGSELFKKGLMALDRPSGEREQKLWEAEGRKPNSIKIGNKWRSIQVLGPIGNILLTGGHFQKGLKETGSPSQAIAQATLGGLKSFSEQTFLTGINQIVSAINDPERSAKSYLGNLAGSAVPTLIGDVARATDTKERRTEDILDRVRTKIPGLRELLEPQIGVLGKEIDTAGNPLEILADPTRPQTAIHTPVLRELRRLTDSGFQVSPTLLGDKAGYKGLTPKQNTNLWKRAGEMTENKLGKLFISQKYQELDDEEKSKVVSDFVDKAKLNARVEFALEQTKDIHGEELKKKLSTLKASGLLTKEVFNQLTKVR